MEEVESIKLRLLSKITGKKLYLNNKQSKYYRLDLVERVINRLASFSDECQECTNFINNLESYIDSIRVNVDKQTIKAYNTFLQKIISHMQLKHKLVNDSYYLTLFIPIGMALGMAFGTVIGLISSFKGISSSGIGIGLCLGVAIGAALDADAKKKRRVI